MRRVIGVLLAFLIPLTLAAQTNTEQAEFHAAAARPDAAQRVAALEQFLAGYPQTGLKLDALQLLVWNSRTGASLADLEHWTSQLVAASPQNPLAAAVILGDVLPIGNPQAPADRAKNAIGALDHFDRPEGLSHEDFAAMKNYVIATLNGVVGYSYFEQKDFAAARPYLRKSVALFPDNAQLTYTLALSDLAGSREDQAEGFQNLARSVNLTRGTPAGDSLATFARKKFVDAGGTNADWDKYLVAAPVAPRVARGEPTVSASLTSPGDSSTAVPGNAAANPPPAKSPAVPSATPNAAPSMAVHPASGTSASTTATSSANASSTSPQPSSPPQPTTTATTTPPASAGSPASAGPVSSNSKAEAAMEVPPPPPPPGKPAYSVMPPRHIPQLVAGAPMSIGLLIQSSLAQRQTRQPIVYSLTDMFRRLHPYDEAFVMSFSKGMVFQEDFTSNDKALESAMDAIAPEQGSAIYDAVTFAAGHLNRISRNPNRVLIVLAGEGDRSSEVSPLELSSELNVSGVRIYCIGLGIASASDMARLQQLAAYTGGRAFFINGTSEVRSALRSISGDLGILYPN